MAGAIVVITASLEQQRGRIAAVAASTTNRLAVEFVKHMYKTLV
jgi:hypothetical protein